MTAFAPPVLVPARELDDEQLRRELADTHRLAAGIDPQVCLPGQQSVLKQRLAELDTEYLARFPQARRSWPWTEA